MCRWGMKSKDASGVGYVRKPTRWMTNSKVLAEILQKECPNKEGRTWHRHVMLCERKSQGGSGISTRVGGGDSQRNKSTDERRWRDQKILEI